MMPKEDETIEYKKSTGKLKEGVYAVCAMLNRNGSGTLYFGITNEGEIVGQQVNSDVLKSISKEIREHIIPRIEPSVESINIGGKNVIKVAFEGNDQPYSAYYRYLVRKGNSDVIMTNEQLAAMFETKRRESWERMSSGLGIESVDEGSFGRFCENGRISERLHGDTDMRSRLSEIGLLTVDGYLNNAGRILFSDTSPVRLRMAVYGSEDRGNSIFSEQFDGNLFQCFEKGCEFIDGYIHNVCASGDVPTDTVKEILVNSLIHRDFDSESVNTMEFTPRSMRITNPGKMPEGKSPRAYSGGNIQPVPRNPVIANAFYLGGLTDSFGTGFQKIYGRFSGTDVECSFTNDMSNFSFELRRNTETEEEKRIEGLSREENIVFGELSLDGRTTVSAICAKHGLTVGIANRVVRDLRSKGMIRREGSNKTGTWIVIR